MTEAGLHKTVQTLQEESGVGMAGSVVLPNTWYAWAIEGQWADILKSLSMLDQQRSRLDLDLLLFAPIKTFEYNIVVFLQLLLLLY